MRYRSRISIVLLIVLLVAFSMPFAHGLDNSAELLIVAIPFLCALAIFATVSYLIADEYIIVKTFRLKVLAIKISQITSIKRTYNPSSSPAASMKRLEIKFYDKAGKPSSVVVSPVREADFINDLKEINPDIEVRVTNRRAAFRFWDWDI